MPVFSLQPAQLSWLAPKPHMFGFLSSIQKYTKCVGHWKVWLSLLLRITGFLALASLNACECIIHSSVGAAILHSCCGCMAAIN